MPTLFSKGSGFLKPTYSVPTQETMPRPLGRCPGGGVSVSSLSFSTACKAQSHGVLWMALLMTLQLQNTLQKNDVLLLPQPSGQLHAKIQKLLLHQACAASAMSGLARPGQAASQN